MMRLRAMLPMAWLVGVGPASAGTGARDALPLISFQRFVHDLRAQD